MTTQRATRKDKGFTLVELMIVIAIIGILAAIGGPRFASYRVKSYNTLARANAHSLLKAFVAYRTEHRDDFPGVNALVPYGYKIDNNVLVGIGYGATADQILIYTVHVRGNKEYEVLYNNQEIIFPYP
jgi:prepilin-type N-terminal cleavage/methylation domain-containing protein